MGQGDLVSGIGSRKIIGYCAVANGQYSYIDYVRQTLQVFLAFAISEVVEFSVGSGNRVHGLGSKLKRRLRFIYFSVMGEYCWGRLKGIGDPNI